MTPEYDVIIVLAGGVNNDGTLPPVPKARVDTGIELINDGKSSKKISPKTLWETLILQRSILLSH